MSVKSWSTLFGAVMVAAVTACTTSDQTDAGEGVDTTTAAAPAPAPSAPAPAPAGNVQLPDGVTAEMVAAGDAQWKAGAICTACHGPDANGTTLAPNLRDSEWLNSDGSYPNIVKTIKEGVAQPKQFTGVMPPMGGAALSDAQVNELAAYIYSISHGG